MGSKFECLKETVVKYSESDCWEKAVDEWESIGFYINDYVEEINNF